MDPVKNNKQQKTKQKHKQKTLANKQKTPNKQNSKKYEAKYIEIIFLKVSKILSWMCFMSLLDLY